MRGPLDSLVGDMFSSDGSGVFDMQALRRWHEHHRRGHDRSGPLWAALTFELWWRAIGAARPEQLAERGRPQRAGHPMGAAAVRSCSGAATS